MTLRTAAATIAISLVCSATAWSQSLLPPRVTREVDLSGPRFGLTVLSDGTVASLKERGISVRPLISQFGWQFERRLLVNSDGVTALMEWVPLLSGLEQGVALPSLNWLVGVRTPSGTEFGIGPNITPVGVGLVIAGGVTVRSGGINVPLNFAIASSKSGPRVTILTGFNLRR
jgi:hypothetical protein